MKRSDYYDSIDLKLHAPDNVSLVNAFVESVKEHVLLPTNHMFEVGCGYGVAVEQMLKYSKKITVSDIDEPSLDFIRWKFLPNTINIQNDNDIPTDADFIYFFMSLHHISNYKDLVTKCIRHIINVRGKGLAICELKPNQYQTFHKHELSPYDGLIPDDFDFINSIPSITTFYEALPTLRHHDTVYPCYSLIIKPL